MNSERIKTNLNKISISKKILIFLSLLLLFQLTSCVNDNNDNDDKKYTKCSEIPEGECSKYAQTCRDDGGYPICVCKDDEIWEEGKDCYVPSLAGLGVHLKPFEVKDGLHVFSAPMGDGRRQLYIFDTVSKKLLQGHVQYRHGIDDPILKSKLTNKFYFYDKTNYYDPFSEVDGGTGGLIEIDNTTGTFKTIYADFGYGRLYDINDNGELIIGGGNSCEYYNEYRKRNDSGYEGKIYNPQTKTYKTFCIPSGTLLNMQYNQNGNIYAYLEQVFMGEEFGDQTAIFEINGETLKTKLIYHTTNKGANFITFNYKNKLYIEDFNYSGDFPTEIDVSGSEPTLKVMGNLKIAEAIGTDLDSYGISMGYRLGEFLYINIFTNDFVEPERYVVVKCSISSGDCEMIANNGNTYQYGYLEDSNMLAFGWQERDSLIDVSTEDRINTFTGKTYPKGYGIE